MSLLLSSGSTKLCLNTCSFVEVLINSYEKLIQQEHMKVLDNAS